MQNISTTGLSITVTASQTYPSGFTGTEFADDADPFDLPALIIAAAAMNLNGILVTWSAPAPILPTLNVISGSDLDINLSQIFEANRAAQGKRLAKDKLTISANYPDGTVVTLSNGVMLSGMPGRSSTQAGRLKSKAYAFAFQDIQISQPSVGL